MAKDTRARILEVASELFIDQGYDGTSLREIADRLGFTKAALYYHFQSKEQILLAVVQPADAMVGELMRRLEAADGVEGWAEALTWILGQMSDKLDVLRLMARNRAAVEEIWDEFESLKEHAEWHKRIEQTVRAKSSDLREQIRMVAALGAVTGFDDWAPTILAEAPPAELQLELEAAIRDILQLPKPRKSRASTGAGRARASARSAR
jgi:AcrR family transcriptional regulator